jgi:hypothetical protein
VYLPWGHLVSRWRRAANSIDRLAAKLERAT